MAHVLVTGGTRGIGLAASRQLALIGHAVTIVGLSVERAAEAAEGLRREGLDVTGRQCDVSDPRAVAALADAVGPVDILVLSAGVMSERMAKTLRTTPEEWHRVMSTNLDGVLWPISSVVPGMVERRSGRVIAVSACLGRMSGPGTSGGLAPYRVSKAAVNALIKNLAAETGQGRRGVLVDAMCPNHCRTDMGGPDAPRSAEEGADTIVWLATREGVDQPTGLLWEDREIVPW
jgi:NAD(P)-dependent dehydrogenase (short-subunit alcohol dehydrogenase family)